MWTIEKINQYIKDQVEENLHLDYKGADSLSNTEGKKNEIGKDVSSFANSDGGTIIYGIKEFTQETKYFPEKIEPINRNSFSKETLEQIINSRISPRIYGIVITPVVIDHAKPNEVVYVVEIPKGTTAHQNMDKRYYRRYNFQAVMMDDWEIKDVINRVQRTQAFLRFMKSLHFDFQIKKHPSRGLKMEFDVQLVNTGMTAITLVECFIKGNSKINNNLISPNASFDDDLVEWRFNNEKSFTATNNDDVEYITNIQRVPILPSTFYYLGSVELFSDFFIDGGTLKISITTQDNVINEEVKGEEVFKLDQ
ncbi:MAG: ATP-binding protein [Chitinophagaceae bacterium]|nr:ATP-binding protein [Chitinophagaceae bacterium]